MFSSFFNPVLNDAGQVAYLASLLTGVGGVDSTNNSGIWRDATFIAREGSQAGGAPAGAVFSGFSIPVLNDAGQVAYLGILLSGGGGVDSTNDRGIWRDSTLIAREGSQAGGTPAGAVFGSLSDPVLNNAGQVAYEGFLLIGVGGVETTSNAGIWRDDTLIAREGSQAGGTPAGAVFSSFGNPVLNNAGQIVYEGFLRSGLGGVEFSNDSGIWRDTTLIAREGSQAGGAPAGAVFNFFNDPVLNDTGQVAYEAFLLTGVGGVDFTNDEGIWITGTNGQSLLVAREGDALEGRTISSLIFNDGSGGSDGRPRGLNNFSQIAYQAGFTNGDQGVFLYTPDIHWTRTFSSSWDSSFNWTLGQLPGDPHDVFIDPDVSLTVSGPTGEVLMTNLTIGGGNGIATLNLNGGTINTQFDFVTVAATGVLTGDGVITGDVDNFGTVIADNVTITGSLDNKGIVTGNGRINTVIVNDFSGEFRVGTGQRLHIASDSGANFNAGRIEVIDGEIEFSHLLNNNASTGLIAAENATLRFNGNLNNNGATAVSFGTSRFFGDINNSATGSIVLSGGSNTTFYDDITNNGSIIVASVGSVSSNAVFFGAVSGAGSITGGGNVFLHGDLRPGNSPAAVFHDVNLFLQSTASTVIELGGTTAGSQHDQINNLKTTTIGGTLEVLLIDKLRPRCR